MPVTFSLEQLQEHIVQEEGFSFVPYQCTANRWTVGYGATRWWGERVTESYPPRVTINEAIGHLRSDAWDAIRDAADYAGEVWPRLSGPRQIVLVSMAFQMGRAGLMGFRRSQALLLAERHEGFADEILDSKWAREDTPARAARLSTQFREG